MTDSAIKEIRKMLPAGNIVPYLGPGIWESAMSSITQPVNHLQLAAKFAERVTVPHKIRKNLTAAAQYIENFKHRKTLASLMNSAFGESAGQLELHLFLAAQKLPLIVDAWYIDALRQALATTADWGQVQGVSRAEHHGEWVRYYDAGGNLSDSATAQQWKTLLYNPIGSANPAQNYIISDSDYVEVLTEIDIQSPIPKIVQQRRMGKNFLFLGCRFTYQLDRIFARQIIKRSSSRHWAVIEGELSKNEKRFLDELNITRIDMPLAEALQQMGTV